MKDLINDFTSHLQEALKIGEFAKFSPSVKTIENIVICGMGGSGIGGTIIENVINDSLDIPLIIVKDYSIPNFVSEKTLFIASSYSGNTEEVISALTHAIEKKANIGGCITSGGKLLDIAKKNNFNIILIPGGNPPRAMFGFSFIQLFYILLYHNLIDDSFKEKIRTSIILIKKHQQKIIYDAKEVAVAIAEKNPIIYSAPTIEGVAIRFRQQLNENSKKLAWHHVIPEMNHNELVGWKKTKKKSIVIFLRNKTDFDRTQKRIEINKEEISKYCSQIIEIWSQGDHLIEQSLYLIHLTDWTSYFIAKEKDIDPIEVNVISSLKDKLGEI